MKSLVITALLSACSLPVMAQPSWTGPTPSALIPVCSLNTLGGQLTSCGTTATPILTGTCTTASKIGYNTAGSFAATCVAQTVILTFATTAPNGWVCNTHDITTVADVLNQTAYTTTSCTVTGTTVASDVITFNAVPF